MIELFIFVLAVTAATSIWYLKDNTEEAFYCASAAWITLGILLIHHLPFLVFVGVVASGFVLYNKKSGTIIHFNAWVDEQIAKVTKLVKGI